MFAAILMSATDLPEDSTGEASVETSAAAATAAILLIGDELLSGKIRDENGFFLTRVLRRRGIRLLEIAVVPDRVETIASSIVRLLTHAELLFTSGGVGPTHDDRTLEAVARATGRELARDATMEALLRAHFGPSVTPAALSMANLPRGTQLRALPGWPVLRLDVAMPATTTRPSSGHARRIYILPGVPDLLRAKVERLETLADELPQGVGWHLTDLYVALEESDLAAALDEVVAAYPGVDIGSYPRWTVADGGKLVGHVRITFEAPRAHARLADEARETLRAALPEHAILAPPSHDHAVRDRSEDRSEGSSESTTSPRRRTEGESS